MNEVQAKSRVLAIHKEGAFQNIKQEEYKQLFYALRSQLNTQNREFRVALGEFLYHGAITFDRFVDSRPAFVDDELYDMFCKFINGLQRMDGKFQGRTYFLHLERIRWSIFRECSLLLFDDEMKTFLNQCEEEINKLLLPDGNERVAQNLKNKKDQILDLINNIRQGKVRTKIHTTLPFKLTETDDTIDLTLDGLNVHVKLKNHSYGCTLPGTKIAEGSTLTTSAPSKWTTTTSEVEIEANCIMDGLELMPQASLQKKEDNRFWTSAFEFTYRVINAIWFYIQQHEEVSGTWPPLPNDIHYIQYRVFAGDIEYDQEYSTNPSLVYRFTSLKKSPKHHVIPEESPNWSVYTHQLAKVYAQSGQLKEAIFWLNVSVEALVEEFIQKVATSDEMLAEIENIDHKFDTAEQILSEQFPDMRGKVQWPDLEIHTSVFTKLKRAARLSGRTNVQQKEISKQYQRVNAKRNVLFHGGSVDITVEDLEKAFNAYAWLNTNL